MSFEYYAIVNSLVKIHTLIHFFVKSSKFISIHIILISKALD